MRILILALLLVMLGAMTAQAASDQYLDGTRVIVSKAALEIGNQVINSARPFASIKMWDQDGEYAKLKVPDVTTSYDATLWADLPASGTEMVTITSAGQLGHASSAGLGLGTVTGNGTDDHITRWDGTDDIQDSEVILSDTGSILHDNGTDSYSLLSTGVIEVKQDVSANNVIETGLYGDTEGTWEVQANGKLAWGPGGASLKDVELDRTGANALRLGTNDSIRFVGGTSFPVSPAPAEGQLFYRSDLDEMYLYDGAGWDLLNEGFTGGGGYTTVQEEGSDLTSRTKVNFIGSAVTAVDNAGAGSTDVTITDGTGGWTETTTNLTPTDADDDLLLHDGSTVGWGNGNPGTLDTFVGRGAAARVDAGNSSTAGTVRAWGGASTNYTQIGAKVRAVETAGTDAAIDTLISTDTNARLVIDANGKHSWGAGGAGSADLTAERTAAHELGLGVGDHLAIQGSSSGKAIVTVAAAAGTPTITLPTVTRTGLTANPATTLPLLVSSAGAESTGSLTVAQGGTGVVTITGIVKGNGTSAMSAATIDTDYVAPTTDQTIPYDLSPIQSSGTCAAVSVGQAYAFNDTGAADEIFFSFALPDTYTGGTITATLYGASRIGGGGGTTVHMEVKASSLADGDAFPPAAYSTAATINSTLNSTGGAGVFKSEKISLTGVTPNGAGAGEHLIVAVRRDSSNASDNYTGIFYLHNLRLWIPCTAQSE